MILMIPVAHYRFPGPAELVGQTDQDHCLSTAAGSAGRVGVGEVPVAAVAG